MASGGINCIKYTMFIFNLLFFLGGGAILGIGIWAAVNAQSFMAVVATNEVIFNAVYVIIAVGAALLVISFLGCCGAIKENKCLLGTFFAIVLIIFIIEIVGGILIFVFYPRIQSAITDSINKYNESNADSSVVRGWDTFQATLQCCGFNSPADWDFNTNWTRKHPGQKLPDSCCVRDIFSLDGTIQNQTNCNSMTSDFYTLGCEAKLKIAYWAVGGVCLGVLAIELLALIFTCCLYRAVGKD